jgi:predicted site-specific integrase-resolvase
MGRKKLVAYYRVSTKQQGESGLVLEGQVAAVATFARTNGAEIVRVYREVETGKRSDRPELLKAIAHAKRSKATLVIAKLDRLARNVAFRQPDGVGRGTSWPATTRTRTGSPSTSSPPWRRTRPR